MSAALELVVIEYACACCGNVTDYDQLITVDGDAICPTCHGEPVAFIGPAENCAECGELYDADCLEPLEGAGRRGLFCPGCWDELTAEDEHEGELEVDCRETCGGPRWV